MNLFPPSVMRKDFAFFIKFFRIDFRLCIVSSADNFLLRFVALLFYIQIFVYLKMSSKKSTINFLGNNWILFLRAKLEVEFVFRLETFILDAVKIWENKKFSARLSWDPKCGINSNKPWPKNSTQHWIYHFNWTKTTGMRKSEKA